MRDKNRLYGFYGQLCDIHRENFPDWRFGQLFINLTNWLWANKSMDIYIPEEDEIVKYLKEFVLDIEAYYTDIESCDEDDIDEETYT